MAYRERRRGLHDKGRDLGEKCWGRVLGGAGRGLEVLESGVIGGEAEPTGQTWWCHSGAGLTGRVS